MKKIFVVVLLAVVISTTYAFSQDKMIITFKDGQVQSFDTNTILKIEYGSTQSSASACWTGRFKGNDISGYAMEINLVEMDGRVDGGYTYYHKGQGQNVAAVITNAVIEGGVLRGTWKQVKGVAGEGKFEWRWLPNEKCRIFEGTFDGTKYWLRMTRQ